MGESMKIEVVSIKNIIAMILLLVVVMGLPVVSFSETDVTEKVQLVQSRLMFDRSTNQNYLDVSVKNISEDVLLTPIKVVIDSISTADVTVANADGVTEDGKPYYRFGVSDLSDGQLDIDESVSQKILFNNPLRKRFTFNTKVFSLLPNAESTIERATTALDEADFESFLVNLDSATKETFERKEGLIPEGMMQIMSNIIRGAYLVEEAEKYKKFEAQINLPNGETTTSHFYMYFENGAWRLSGL